MVTADGNRILTRFPADELIVAGRQYVRGVDIVEGRVLGGRGALRAMETTPQPLSDGSPGGFQWPAATVIAVGTRAALRDQRPGRAAARPATARSTAMLPFAAVLAIAAIGQTLVIQQGGIDLSVPGMISLTVVIMTHHPAGD